MIKKNVVQPYDYIHDDAYSRALDLLYVAMYIAVLGPMFIYMDFDKDAIALIRALLRMEQELNEGNGFSQKNKLYKYLRDNKKYLGLMKTTGQLKIHAIFKKLEDAGIIIKPNRKKRKSRYSLNYNVLGLEKNKTKQYLIALDSILGDETASNKIGEAFDGETRILVKVTPKLGNVSERYYPIEIPEEHTTEDYRKIMDLLYEAKTDIERNKYRKQLEAYDNPEIIEKRHCVELKGENIMLWRCYKIEKFE